MSTEHSTSGEGPLDTRRSRGQIIVARALWYVKPGAAELRNERLSPLTPSDARVATEFSAISRGTERLVARGEVPESEWPRMRAPLQAGDFPFPVKYGYSAAGVVTAGPHEIVGRRVFALHPHQDHFQTAASNLVPIPDAVPSRRATLAANMETALNAHWDAATAPGDRILVVGAGIVGLLVAYLAHRIAGTDVTITDIDPTRAETAKALGLKFAAPGHCPEDCRLVFHTSASSDGLATAIASAAFEGTIIEMSWYGSRPVTVELGGAFHSRRLKLVSSQVGHVAPSHRAQVTLRARLERALALLDDPALDCLVAETVPFADLPVVLPQIWSSATLPPVIAY
ncbi:dehydrogenase [Hyphomicrobium methylovorum]|uniref:zinc-dependent alcohol dehydrogenase n=1 Tax=Hyphomicrobium methylovorum TaxID=84 RepID=UPI0015E69CA9|nr:zinc-binding alcohol dehydrogenase [Hyphomicrobium methylovorum]MBA2127657.1 dehydrogenase [Hyphomicrobium methylovorum]